MCKDHKKRIFPVLPAMRGKALHKYITKMAAEGLVKIGFDISAEHPVCLPSGGRDYVDIFVRCDSYEMVVEIETTPRNVLVNATKAEELGLRMWIVTPNKKVSSAIVRKLNRNGLLDNTRIRIMTIGQFLDFGIWQLHSVFKLKSKPEKAGNQSTPNGHGINNETLH